MGRALPRGLISRIKAAGKGVGVLALIGRHLGIKMLCSTFSGWGGIAYIKRLDIIFAEIWSVVARQYKC